MSFQDTRILLIDYSHELTTILQVAIENELRIDAKWQLKNKDIVDIASFAKYFDCAKLILEHKYLNILIKGVCIVLNTLSEKETSDLLDLWLTIKSRIRYDESIKLENSDINCLKMLCYQYGETLLQLY